MSQQMGDKRMLILTRRVQEELTIGDDIKILVLGIRGGQVRLGLTAPPSVAIHRKEIYERIQREREEEAARVQRLALTQT